MLTQAFLPRKVALVSANNLVKQSHDHLMEVTVLAHFAKLIKAVSAVAVVADAADLFINFLISKPVWKNS